jgi:hypothetical protein
MRLPKPALVLLVLLVGITTCHAQKKSSINSRFKVPKVSRSKALIMCPIFLESKYPYRGIGFKVGDPFALTYKFYPSKHFAFAADVGKAASGLYNKYYRNAFNGYIPDTLKSDQSVKYLSHTPLHDWFVETKFLYQWDAEKLTQGLQIYAGLGWQWRSTRLQYEYLKTNGTVDSQFGSFTVNRFTYGPVVLAGFEYSYFTLPISAFIEIEWFTDALLDPGYNRFQGGVGLRYIF